MITLKRLQSLPDNDPKTITRFLSQMQDNIQTSLKQLATFPITQNNLTFIPSPSAFGDVSNVDFRNWMIGDRMYVSGTFKMGTTGAGDASIVLPIAIDPKKITSLVNTQQLGTFRFLLNAIGPSNIGAQDGPVFYDGSTTNAVFLTQSMGVNILNKNAGSMFSGSDNTLIFEFSYPMVGF